MTMIMLVIAAILVILISGAAFVAVQVKNDMIRQWAINWALKSGAAPVPKEPEHPANLIYANDMAFNVRVVISFILAFLILIMLAAIVAVVGIGALLSFL